MEGEEMTENEGGKEGEKCNDTRTINYCISLRGKSLSIITAGSEMVRTERGRCCSKMFQLRVSSSVTKLVQ